MSVRTDIINDALTVLEQSLTTGPDSSTDPIVVRLVSVYNRRAKIMLSEYPWNFAKKVQQLEALATPLEGWTYSFNKPAQCVRIIKVDNQADMRRRNNIDFEDRGGAINTNNETTFLAYVDGTYAENDSGAWPEICKNGLGYDLANFCKGKTHLPAGRLAEIDKEAKEAMAKARRWDAQQNQKQDPPLSSWQRQRLSGGTGRNG